METETARLDLFFATLASHQRRHLLHHLSGVGDDPTTVQELADVLIKSGTADPQRARFLLQHVHLPKLKDMTVVDYDPRTETVRYHGSPLLDQMLEECQKHE